jgi:hypothetical protein
MEGGSCRGWYRVLNRREKIEETEDEAGGRRESWVDDVVAWQARSVTCDNGRQGDDQKGGQKGGS